MKCKNKVCIDCGKIISKKAIRCKTCSNKYRVGAYKWIHSDNIKGYKNSQWKGNKVKYDALHDWVRRNKLKPRFCEKCSKKPPYDLSNISGEYKRDINDYEWLCRSCHMKLDKKSSSIREHGRKYRLKQLNLLGDNH